MKEREAAPPIHNRSLTIASASPCLADNGKPLSSTAVGVWDPWVVCPECGGALEPLSEGLGCLQCSKSWPMVDGIPHFVQEFPYWGEFSQEEVQTANRRAAQGTAWPDCLPAASDAATALKRDMILNLGRANWHCLANLSPATRVLDIGAGMGTNAHALAKRYRDVVAVEPVLERIEFMRHRFAQEQLSNVKLVRSSVWTLPFPPESFDLIVMNGVLEWVAQGRTEDPGLLQHMALERAYQLLRPGGVLYVGIENRLLVGLLRGARDPHCGLPYVTILPRRLAHWYARTHGLPNGYRNYLYSSRGYRNLMRKAGFGRVKIYIALPIYNHPLFYIPLEGPIFHYYSRNFDSVRSGGLVEKAHWILAKMRLLKYFQGSYAIFATK